MTAKLDSFRKIYSFAFDYYKTPGSRAIPMENAVAVWSMLLPIIPASAFAATSAWNPHRSAATATKAFERWQAYLTSENKARPLSKDVWNQVRRAAEAPADAPVPRLHPHHGRLVHPVRRRLGLA